MPITVTCPNPSCGQVCAVQDQYAGMQVSCPKCQTVFGVPAAAAPVAPVAAVPPPVSMGAPGAPMGPGFGGVMDNVARLAGDPLSKTLLLAGLGCMAGIILFVFLPWVSFGFSGNVGGKGISIGGFSVSGISIWWGVVTLLLTLGVAGFVAATIFMNRADLFQISILVAAGWSGLLALWRLINVIEAGSLSGIGLYLSLLASLGAAGTFGFMAFQRLVKRPPVVPPPPPA